MESIRISLRGMHRLPGRFSLIFIQRLRCNFHVESVLQSNPVLGSPPTADLGHSVRSPGFVFSLSAPYPCSCQWITCMTTIFGCQPRLERRRYSWNLNLPSPPMPTPAKLVCVHLEEDKCPNNPQTASGRTCIYGQYHVSTS